MVVSVYEKGKVKFSLGSGATMGWKGGWEKFVGLRS